MKISSLLRIVPIIFAGIIAITLSVHIYSIHQDRRILEEQISVRQFGENLLSASDFLTEQARFYAQSGDKEYLEAYIKEVNITKTRERVLEEMKRLHAPLNEIALVDKAKELSYDLELIEEEAFLLVEQNKLEEARDLLFSEKYKAGKQPIIDTLNLFNQTVITRCVNQALTTRKQADAALIVMMLSIIAMLVTAITSAAILSRKIKRIGEMERIAHKLADGIFDVDFTPYESKDEFGLLAKSFNQIIHTVYGIQREISTLISHSNLGDLNYQINSDNYKGYKENWAQILTGLNNFQRTIRESIIEKAPVAYVVVKDDIIIDCNRYAKDKIGMVAGAPIEKYYVDPEERNRAHNKLETDRGLNMVPVTLQVRNKEHHRFSMFTTILQNSHGQATIKWYMDIEDVEHKNDTLRQNQEDLQALINALPMAMVIQNPFTDEVEYANTAFYDLLELPKTRAFSDISMSALYHVQQTDGLTTEEKEEAFRQRTFASPYGQSMDFTYRTITGKVLDTRVISSQIIFGGKKCLIMMIQDIEAEKLQNKLLLNAAEHEREANQLKSRFLANMSHEIRTPMNAIVGLTQIALARGQDATNTDTYRKIHSSAKNLLTIINDILDFSKIEAQKVELVEEVFNLEDIVANAFMIASERIEDKRVEMLLDIEPTLPVFLYGDKTRLWQILKNILDNSAKYTEDGRVVLKIFEKKREDGKIQISFRITDTGIGMSQEQVDALFVPFQQFSDSYKYKTSGTGLGMSITKQLLDLMDGSLDIESNIGIGTTFTIHLSFGLTDSEDTIMQVVSRRDLTSQPVLIADDDQFSRNIMQKLLESAGFSVTSVASGEEVLDTVLRHEAQNNPFRLVILDYLLGRDDGIKIGRELAKSSNYTKLLMVSAYVKQIPEAEIRDVGFSDILQKPFIPSSFIQKLCHVLDEDFSAPNVSREGFVTSRVLLCEDNSINQEVALEMLKLLGIQADVASNGLECLELLEKAEYDLILMDILMPVMDGMEATLKIRNSDKPYKDINILAMTANVMLEQIDEFMAIGMNGYIPKPIDLDVLYSELAKVLSISGPIEGDTAPHLLSESHLAIEGIHIKDGLARFGGNEERYKKSLLSFANSYSHLDEPQMSEGFRRYIHTLKGVMGNLGMYGLAETAKMVEKQLMAESPDFTIYDAFKTAVQEIIQNIQKNVIVATAATSPQKSGTKEQYLKLMEDLNRGLLTAIPSNCEKILDTLMNTQWDLEDISLPDFNELCEAIEDYNFERALKIIETDGVEIE